MADHEQEPLTHLDIDTVIDVIGKLESMEETLCYWNMRLEMYEDDDYHSQYKVIELITELRSLVKETKKTLSIY